MRDVRGPPCDTPARISPGPARVHDLWFDTDARAAQISVAPKCYQKDALAIRDQTFVDGLGREVHLRGWNVSGSAKLVETGYLPFRNNSDAKDALDTMGDQSGANVIRLLVTWEGVNPRKGQIDDNYLAQVAQEIHLAAQNHMHVLLDFHQDL